MDTIDFFNVLIKDQYSAQIFIGAMARDEFILEFKSNPYGHFIFNTHNSNEPGEHWISVYRKGNHIIYFDSFAFPLHKYPDVYQTISTIKNCRLVWNKETLQGITTTTCGDYSILFCLLVACGWSLKKFVKRMLQISGFEKRDHTIHALLIDLYVYW